MGTGKTNEIGSTFAPRADKSKEATMDLGESGKTKYSVSSGSYAAGVPYGKGLLVCGGLGPKNQVLNKCQLLAFDKKSSELSVDLEVDMPGARWGHGLVSLKKNVFLIGGSDGKTSVDLRKDVHRFQTKKAGFQEWLKVKGMKSARAHFAVDKMEAENKIMVASGQSKGGNLTKLCEFYDAGKDEWHSFTTVPEARAGLRGIFHKKRFFVIGGRTSSDSVTNRVDAFDPKTGQWEEMEPLNRPRAFHNILHIDDKLVVIGGDDPHPTVEIYDDKKDVWTTTTHSFDDCQTHAAVAALF